MKKKIFKNMGHDSKTEDQKRIKQNCFHRAMSADVAILWVGAILGGGRQREEKKNEKTQFIVFCQPYKTPNGSKKKQKNKRVGFNRVELLEALARRFIWFGEKDVRPRVIQGGRIGGPGRG